MFDSRVVTPVFYGKDVWSKDTEDPSSQKNFDVRISHPACYGYYVEEEGDFKRVEDQEQPVDIKKAVESTAKEYLEKEVFPTLLPALEEMLQAAKDNDVLKWKRTKFNACDYLTEYLYNHNPRSTTREKLDLWQIPFVQRINTEKPRPPLPLSLLLSDEEAAIMIQSFWRGCMVRMNSEVQELRQYQKEMREQEYDILLKVEDFWRKHPVEGEQENKANDKEEE